MTSLIFLISFLAAVIVYGIYLQRRYRFIEQGFYPSRLDGRSCRGDTCIGAYVAMRLSKTPLEAGIWAAAVTSLKVERLGPFDRPIHDVEVLIKTCYNHASFH
jgi:hypothetical protein